MQGAPLIGQVHSDQHVPFICLSRPPNLRPASSPPPQCLPLSSPAACLPGAFKAQVSASLEATEKLGAQA